MLRLLQSIQTDLQTYGYTLSPKARELNVFCVIPKFLHTTPASPPNFLPIFKQRDLSLMPSGTWVAKRIHPYCIKVTTTPESTCTLAIQQIPLAFVREQMSLEAVRFFDAAQHCLHIGGWTLTPCPSQQRILSDIPDFLLPERQFTALQTDPDRLDLVEHLCRVASMMHRWGYEFLAKENGGFLLRQVNPYPERWEWVGIKRTPREYLLKFTYIAPAPPSRSRRNSFEDGADYLGAPNGQA